MNKFSSKQLTTHFMENKIIKILAIDDNPDNLISIKALIKDAFPNAITLTAHNGKGGIEIAIAENPDVILLDIVMPEMDGFEVCHKLKANKNLNDIPVVFVTALKGDKENRIHALECGAEGFLSKPIDETELTAQIRAMVKIREANIQKHNENERLAALVKERTTKLEQELIKSKQIEEELLTSKNFAENLIETANTMVVGLDINGNVKLLNKAAEIISGYTFAELENRNWFEIVVPKDRYPNVWFEFERIMKYGVPRNFENPIQTKSGEEHFISWQNNETYEYDKVIGTISFGLDITERKKAEELIKLRESYLSAIFENLPGLIWLKDIDGRFLMVNEKFANSCQRKVSDVIGKTDLDIWPKELAEKYMNDDSKVINKKKSLNVEEQILHHGETKWFETFKLPIIDDKDNIIGTSGYAMDITERKNAELQLKELNSELEQRVAARTAQLESINKELESFSYSVSHDLRAPLRAINGFTTALQLDYAKKMDDEFKRITELLKNSTIKMGSLIDDLLNFSRLGRKELVKIKLDMNVLVKKVLSDLETDKMENVKITVGELHSVNGDSALLSQVLINLISNALKYSSKKPISEIEINSCIKDGEYIFWVKDNGTGFNMKYADKLFVVFQRLHDSKDFEGTGVGLAIVKRIITKHGGKTWAEGIAGIGSTFYFSLPIIS